LFGNCFLSSRSCGAWLLAAILPGLVVGGCGPATKPEESAAAAVQGSEQSAENADGAVASETPADPPPARPTSRLQELSFDDVKFEMEKGDPFTEELLPEAVASLDGARIRIRGYILPSFQQEGITQFVLVRDNMECCFGPGAALYDCIVVRMLPGRSTNFSVRPVAVSGTFHIEELIGPDGRHLAIYSLDGEEVE